MASITEHNIISRREFLKRAGFAALTASVSSVLPACSVGKEETEALHILHTNDVHSHIDPFPPHDPAYPGLGGYAPRQAFVESQRAKHGANNVLYFECGDMFQGTPYFNLYRGNLEMKLMNMMHVDAVTIGNHEFDNGVEGLCDCMEVANFPFISSNYLFSDARGSQLVKPYQVYERANMRIGVFGLGVALQGLVNEANYKGVTYVDPIIATQEMVNKLRLVEQCDLVIALTHIGYSSEGSDAMSDLKLAHLTEGIDIILGGHSHTFLQHPEFVPNRLGKTVVVNQVGYAGVNVGHLKVARAEGRQVALLDAHCQPIQMA